VNSLNSQVEQEFSDREKHQGLHGIVEHNIQRTTEGAKGTNSQLTYQPPEPRQTNNISVKNYQPIQITIASPTEQGMALAERCKKLEEYCRELIRTNKILDCENRIAIAQILALTEPRTQLQNLQAALTFVRQSGKLYDKKPA
jgi:hypothetical protein